MCLHSQNFRYLRSKNSLNLRMWLLDISSVGTTCHDTSIADISCEDISINCAIRDSSCSQAARVTIVQGSEHSALH